MMSILSGVLTGEKVAGARAVGVSIADRIHWTEPPLDLAGQLLLWVLNRIFNVKVS
jgi:hypothetical protein